jgi:hypothetical protein
LKSTGFAQKCSKCCRFHLAVICHGVVNFGRNAGDATVRGKAVAFGRKPLTEPGLAKGAEDEKVVFVDSDRSGARDAGAGG